MASNYKFYRRPAIVIRSNAKSGGGRVIVSEHDQYVLQRQSDELYEKLMEAEAVIRELQADRRKRWLSKADPPHSTINPPSFETQPKLNPEGLKKLKQERKQTND